MKLIQRDPWTHSTWTQLNRYTKEIHGPHDRVHVSTMNKIAGWSRNRIGSWSSCFFQSIVKSNKL